VGDPLQNNTPEAHSRRRTAHTRRSDRRAPDRPGQGSQSDRKTGRAGLRLRLTALPAAGAADARLRHDEVERLRPGDDVREWERSGHRLPIGSPEGVSEANQTSAEEPAAAQRNAPRTTSARATARLVRVPTFLIPPTCRGTRHPQARGVTERSFALAPGWSSDFTDRIAPQI